MKTVEIALQPQEAASNEIIENKLRKQLGLSESDKLYYSIRKRSIDSRSKEVKIRLQINFTINESLSDKPFENRKLQNVNNSAPIVIIGCGPAGMFAALRLIESGFKPIIIERGKTVKDRRRDLAAINKLKIVNPDSNYCFGEGGAGTYSDGKLYTRSNKRGDINRILNTFIEFGASPTIAIDAHPHIGTNKLPGIIENMRNAILACGGEILFQHRFEKFVLDGNKIKGVIINSINNEAPITIATIAVIMATGHSARDIFEYFHRENFLIEAKPFALGVRIEHPQEIIDAAQYHCVIRNEFLPPASYALVHQANSRGVYSFCMCPGGIIAPASTSPGEIVINGWSPSKRNNPFANSGIVVSVELSDLKKFEKDGALAAMNFQKEIEQQAFIAGGNNLAAPAQRMIDFVQNKLSDSLPKCSYIPGVNSVKMDELLPEFITSSLRNAFAEFGKKMKGYYTNEAIIVATESRTSSPVRIPRDKISLMHTQLEGLFPCAEGAGYAGGIISAAMDGESCAEAIEKYFN